MQLYPRLKFDIGWRHLFAAAFGPTVGLESSTAAVKSIESLWPGRDAVVGLSVRTLFDALLTELQLPKGSVVVVSAINIEGMVQIIQAHGLRVVAVDIDPRTLAPPPGAVSDACCRHAARVCLIAQLYGAVSPIADAAELREKGVTVVEDAAQAFAGRFYLGDTEASVSLFSFGPIKRATALGGAVAVMRDSDLAARVGDRLESRPALSETWFRRRAVKYIVLKAICGPAVYALLIRTLGALGRDPDQIIGRAARGFSGPNLLTSIRRRPPRRLAALLAARLKEEHDHQSRRAATQELELACGSVARPVGQNATLHSAWLAPLLVEEPAKVVSALRQAGFDATRGATSLRAIDANAAVLAAEVIRQVVYLPHPADLNAKQRSRLHSAVVSAVSGLSPASGGRTP